MSTGTARMFSSRLSQRHFWPLSAGRQVQHQPSIYQVPVQAMPMVLWGTGTNVQHEGAQHDQLCLMREPA